MNMLLRAEECWVERLKDPSVPPAPTDKRYDGGEHDHTIPVKNLTPLSMPLSKRDSLLEKCAMFRELGGGLSRYPSQDNGLDGPTGPCKLEQAS
nr:unconventional myosin-XVI-like [Oncorhynchus nerka]